MNNMLVDLVKYACLNGWRKWDMMQEGILEFEVCVRQTIDIGDFPEQEFCEGVKQATQIFKASKG